MDFLKRNTKRNYSRNGDIIGGASVKGSTVSSSSSGANIDEIMGKFLPATKNGDGTYTVPFSVTFEGDVIGKKEVTAWGKGNGGGGTTPEGGGGENPPLDLKDYYKIEQVDALLMNKANVVHKHEIADINGLSEKLVTYDDFIKNGITSDKYLLKETWDKAFYFDENNNVRVKLNLIGDKEITAYGKGSTVPEGGGGGAITIIDSLTSSATDAALSANQGRILKSLIDNKEVNLSDYVKKTDVVKYDNHLADKVSHITSQERTNWNNKLDKTIWDKAFYFDEKNNIHAKINFVGDKEVVAYGKGSTVPEGGGGGVIDIADNLTTNESNVALSARQGVILNDMIANIKVPEVNLSEYAKIKDVDNKLSNKVDKVNGKGLSSNDFTTLEKNKLNGIEEGANKYVHPKTHPATMIVEDTTHRFVTDTEKSNWNNKLDKSIWDKVFEIKNDNDLRVKLNILGDKEITAHAIGSSIPEGGGAITIVDSLLSNSTDAALSANQGRVLKEMIDNKTVDVNLDNYYTISQVNNELAKKANVKHTHSTSDITNLDSKLLSYDNHLKDNVKHITSQERTNWNDANTKKHTHDNKAVLDGISSTNITNWNDANTQKHTHTNKVVLDGITSTKVSNWDNVVSNWNKAFYFEGNAIRAKLNLIGDKEIAAYGKGNTVPEGGGAITIIDSLQSNATDAALSANQGRILKDMIDNKVVDVNLSEYLKKTDANATYAKKTEIPSLNGYATQQWVLNKGYISSYTNNYLSSVSGSGNGNVTFNRYGLSSLYLDLSHTHSQYLTSHQSLSHLANKNGTNVSGTWDNLSIGGNAATADKLKVLKHNEGNYYTFINATRTDGTQSREIVDDGWRLKFVGTRPYYENNPLATLNDEVAKSKEAIKINSVDNRSIGDKPRAKKQGVYSDLKQNSTNGLKDGGSFNCALTIRGYGEAEDFTGGYPHQLAFTDNGNIWTRRAENQDTWRSWNKIWHSGIFNPDAKVNKEGKYSIYTDDTKPYNYIHLFRIANKATWSHLRVDIDFKSRYNAAKLYIDISTNDKTYGEGNSYLRISQLCANDRTAEFYVKQTVAKPKPDEPTTNLYNYYDIYYKSGSWNMGSYEIVSKGKNGDLFFEPYNKKLESLPQGTSKVLEKLNVNGNITASGEITAYAAQTKAIDDNTPMTLAEPIQQDVRVFDGLNSNDTNVALSANQGRLLLAMIDDLQAQINDLKTNRL